jgi:hypothetical protein
MESSPQASGYDCVGSRLDSAIRQCPSWAASPYGTVSGPTYAIYDYGGRTSYLYNYGSITSGATGTAIQTDSTTADHIYNSGSIVGAVDLAAAYTGLVNAGTINGW